MKRTPSFLAALTPTATMAYALVSCAPAPAASPTAQPAADQPRPSFVCNVVIVRYLTES